MKERNKAVDISKGLGILLVMIGHLSLPMWIINLIYFFHMPFFIGVSGYFNDNDIPFRNVLKKGFKLIYSYIFYGVIFISVGYLLSGELRTELLRGFVLAKPITIWNITFFGVFWYITALFTIKVLISAIKVNFISGALAFVLFFVVLGLQHRFIFIKDLPLSISQSLVLMIFYVIGSFLPKLDFKFRWKVFITSIFAFLILSAVAFSFHATDNIKLVNYHQIEVFNPFMALGLAISGMLALYTISQIISSWNGPIIGILAFIGKYSFAFYALHLFLFFIVGRLIVPLNLIPEMSIAMVLIFSIIIISVLILLGNRVLKNQNHIRQLIFLR